MLTLPSTSKQADRTPSATCARGAGCLSVGGQGGISRAEQVQAREPLRWLVPQSRGPAVWAYAASFGGGILAGDSLQMTIDVAPDARLFLGTQASTKIYRSDAEEHVSRQDIVLDVGADALALIAPDPVTCFQGARYCQRQYIRLHPRGSLFLAECCTAGRLSRGERWAWSSYTTTTTIERDGHVCWRDRQFLDPATVAPPVGVPVIAYATVVLVGDLLQPLRDRIAGDCADGRVSATWRDHGLLLASGTAPSGVTTIRAAITDLDAWYAWLHGSLDLLAKACGGRPWRRRP